MSKKKTKICSKCKKEKSREDFYKRSDRKDGRRSRCKVCCKNRVLNYQTSKKGKAVRRLHRKTEKAKNTRAKYHKKYKTTDAYKRTCRKNRLRVYGITIKQYEEMLKRQGGCCAICGGINENGRRLAVDHDHETGKNRGLLCDKCNLAIGLFGDIARLASAIKYLSGGA